MELMRTNCLGVFDYKPTIPPRQ